MTEIELSKRLRTDDGDNLPVIGPGGALGYWVQGGDAVYTNAST